MMENVEEIKKVLKDHNYRLDSLLKDVLEKFQLKKLCYQARIEKQQGYSTVELLNFMIIMPLMLIKTGKPEGSGRFFPQLHALLLTGFLLEFPAICGSDYAISRPDKHFAIDFGWFLKTDFFISPLSFNSLILILYSLEIL